MLHSAQKILYSFCHIYHMSLKFMKQAHFPDGQSISFFIILFWGTREGKYSCFLLHMISGITCCYCLITKIYKQSRVIKPYVVFPTIFLVNPSTPQHHQSIRLLLEFIMLPQQYLPSQLKINFCAPVEICRESKNLIAWQSLPWENWYFGKGNPATLY